MDVSLSKNILDNAAHPFENINSRAINQPECDSWMGISEMAENYVFPVRGYQF